MRPFSPSRETGIETIARTTVMNQISGSKMKYERRRLSHPYFLDSIGLVEAGGGTRICSDSCEGFSISVVDVFTDGTAYQMRAPSNRIASPTMYIDPVITTTASGRAEVCALA